MALTPYAELLGVRLVEATADRVVAELDFRPQVQQLTGVFHAASLVGVAKAAATECAQLAAGADAAPLTLAQMSMNLMRNTNQSPIAAEAKALHRGRTLVVVETTVRDHEGRTLCVLNTTHTAEGQA